MKDKNIIKTITIDIAGTEVKVTPEQAKNLHTALGDLLGLDAPKEKIVEKHIYKERGWDWYWRYPTWVYSPYVYDSGITYGTSSNTFASDVTPNVTVTKTNNVQTTTDTARQGNYQMTYNTADNNVTLNVA